MDIEAYRIRRKKSVAELAGMLGVKEAAVYNYKYGKSKPSYESIEKMLLDGAYLSEIFDDEVQERVKLTLERSSGSEIFDNAEFKEGLDLASKPLTRNEAIALIKELKEKGEI